MNQERLTPQQASQYLGDLGLPYKESSLRVMRSQGRGPRFFKHFKKIYYLISDLNDWASLAQPVETRDSVHLKSVGA